MTQINGQSVCQEVKKYKTKIQRGGYLLRRVPPAFGDPGVLLHRLVFDQLLALALQLLNLRMGKDKETCACLESGRSVRSDEAAQVLLAVRHRSVVLPL